MTEKPKSENCFDVYEEYTKTGEEIYVYRARTGKWLPKERLDPFGE